jgi:hypothetical protein
MRQIGMRELEPNEASSSGKAGGMYGIALWGYITLPNSNDLHRALFF